MRVHLSITFSGALVALALAVAPARATPSTNFWAPSTPALQPFRVLHLTYDSYVGRNAAYSNDYGLTIGVLPWTAVQMEVGADVLYPTFHGTDALAFPITFNAKIGSPEDALFHDSPGWSVGIYNLGIEPDVTDVDILYAMVGKTLPHVGALDVGGYYGINKKLLVSSSGSTSRAGVLAGWASPSIKVPVIDHIAFTADVQTGESSLGGAGGGVYFYLTPSVDVLTGPVVFFDRDLQPGKDRWMWSVQLDADLDFTGGKS